MNQRRKALGNKNMIGRRTAQLRKERGMRQIDLMAKMQTLDVDVSLPSLSLLEGQHRAATDIEVNAIAFILDIDIHWLMNLTDTISPYPTFSKHLNDR